MVIVSNIYKVAFRSYDPFSTEMLKSVSSGICHRKNGPDKNGPGLSGRTDFG